VKRYRQGLAAKGALVIPTGIFSGSNPKKIKKGIKIS